MSGAALARRGGLWCALALLAFALAYFAPALWEGRVLAPGDGIAQNMPVRVLTGEAFRRGEMPFWNPYNFSGMPLFATIHPGVLFPGNAPYWLLPMIPATDLTVIAAFWIASAATYAFARALDLPRAAAMVAALVYAYGGFMACRVGPIQMAQVAGLVPLSLWAIERLARTGARRYALALWAVLVLEILAGHPQVMIFGGLVVAPYAVFRAATLARRAGFIGQLLLAAALAVGVGLVQLLPGLDLIAESQRQAPNLARLVEGSLPPRYLPTLLFPFLYGNVPTPWFAVPYWGVGLSMFGYFGYTGLAPLLLALVALLGPGRAGAEAAPVRFWGVVAALSLALALGEHTPLYQLWARLPVFDQLAGPNRHFMEFDLAVALLSGYGLAWLARGGDRRPLWLATGLVGLAMAAVLAAVAIAGPGFAHRAQALMPPGIDLAFALSLARPAFWVPPLLAAMALALVLAYARRPGLARGGALALFVFADLALFGQHYGWRQFSPRAPHDFARAFYREDGRTLALPAVTYPYFGGLAPLVALHMPGIGALEGESSVGGYDAFILARYNHVLGFSSLGDAADVPALWRPEHHALDLLGLRWLRLDPMVAARPVWDDRLAPPRWQRVAAAPDVITYENRRALPRAWRAAAVRALPPAEVDRRVMADPAFDPRAVALVDAPAAVPVTGPGSARATTTALDRIELATDGAGPGFVVVSESYDPGWQALAPDGTRAPVTRVDGVVMGVAVPAGAHRLTLVYEPPRWRTGLAAALASLAATLAWALWPRGRKPETLA